MEDTVLFHQVFSVENIVLTQIDAEFTSEFIERGVPLIASRLDLDGADFSPQVHRLFLRLTSLNDP